MSGNNRVHFSGWLYKVGAVILFILSVVALVSFMEAVKIDYQQEDGELHSDSIQIEMLRSELIELNRKVDSLLVVTNQEPEVAYKYFKTKKDSTVIEVNVHSEE